MHFFRKKKNLIIIVLDYTESNYFMYSLVDNKYLFSYDFESKCALDKRKIIQHVIVT